VSQLIRSTHQASFHSPRSAKGGRGFTAHSRFFTNERLTHRRFRSCGNVAEETHMPKSGFLPQSSFRTMATCCVWACYRFSRSRFLSSGTVSHHATRSSYYRQLLSELCRGGSSALVSLAHLCLRSGESDNAHTPGLGHGLAMARVLLPRFLANVTSAKYPAKCDLGGHPITPSSPPGRRSKC